MVFLAPEIKRFRARGTWPLTFELKVYLSTLHTKQYLLTLNRLRVGPKIQGVLLRQSLHDYEVGR
jgi:hypothetical protein